MSELVDIAISVNAQAAAESLGLRIVRNVTSGTWVRRIPQDEAEMAVECLRNWGFIARIVEREPRDDPPTRPGVRRAA